MALAQSSFTWKAPSPLSPSRTLPKKAYATLLPLDVSILTLKIAL